MKTVVFETLTKLKKNPVKYDHSFFTLLFNPYYGHLQQIVMVILHQASANAKVIDKQNF